jgi:hypothetical protein
MGVSSSTRAHYIASTEYEKVKWDSFEIWFNVSQ